MQHTKSDAKNRSTEKNRANMASGSSSLEMAEVTVKSFDDAQRADVNDPRFQKVRRQQTRFDDLLGSARERPSIHKAERYRKMTCPHQRVEKEEDIPEEIEVVSEEIKVNGANVKKAQKSAKKRVEYVEWPILDFESFEQFGVGIQLYFSFLKRMINVFLLLSILAVPSIIIYAAGTTLTDRATTAGSTGFLETVSLGNVRQGANSTELYFFFSSEAQPIDRTSEFVSFMDFASTTLLLIFLYLHARSEKKEAESLKDRVLTVADYTVRVTGLPQSIPSEILRYRLRDFFQDKGYETFDIVVCENNADQLDTYGELGRIYNEYDSLMAKHSNLDVSDFPRDDQEYFHDIQKRIDLKKEEIKLWDNEHNRKNVCAFVTLERHEEVADVLAMFRKSLIQKMFNFFTLQGDTESYMEETLPDGTVERFYFKVEQAEEPSNVLYHNLKFTRTGRLLRRVATFFATIASLSLSFAIIAYAMWFQNQNIPPINECTSVITKAQAAADATLVNCYCQSLGSSVFNTGEQEICGDWLYKTILTKLLIVASAFSISLLNYGLKTFVGWLVVKERHFTLSHEQSAVANKLFFCLFLNTSIIILVINANIKSFLPNFPTVGTYSEFTSGWYDQVGVQISLTLMINMVSPQMIPFLFSRPYQRFRIWWSAESVEKSGTQTELNDLYSGHKFLLAERYAALMNTFFSVLFYNPGLPILTIMGLVAFFLTYWFDKVSSIPPSYNSNIAELTTGLLPYAIPLHLFIATFMYGGPVWGTNIEDLSTAIGSSTEVLVRWQKDYPWAQNIFHANSFPLFVYFLIIVGVRILWYLKDFSPISLKIEVDFLKEEAFKKKLPRVSVVASSGIHYIASYRISRQSQYYDAFLKPLQKASDYDLLPLEDDLPNRNRQMLSCMNSFYLFFALFAVQRVKSDQLVESKQVADNVMDTSSSSDSAIVRAKSSSAASKIEEVRDIAVLFPDLNPAGNIALNGNPTICDECDYLVAAYAHCVECNSDLCTHHIELHKYSKSLRGHQFVPLSAKVVRQLPPDSNVRPEQMLSVGSDIPIPLIIPLEPAYEGLHNDYQFWHQMANLIYQRPDQFTTVTCPNRIKSERIVINPNTGAPIKHEIDEPCKAPLRIFLWPDNKAHTYQCLYCKQGFGV